MHSACPAASPCISCVCASATIVCNHRVQTRAIQSLASGLQGPAYYLHNGSLAFNLALLLALGRPLLAALQHLCRRAIVIPARIPAAGGGADTDARQSAGQRRKGRQGALLGGGFGVQSRGVAALAPLWLWLTVISLLPHKEERFLYVVYPLVSPGMTRRHLGASSGPSHRHLLASQMCEACSAALQHCCVTTPKLALQTRRITSEVTCCCRFALLQRYRLAQSGMF
jgi:Alg9-like mannosyltransferase family